VKTVCRTVGLARSHLRDLLVRDEDWTDGRSHRTPTDDTGLAQRPHNQALPRRTALQMLKSDTHVKIGV